MSTMWEMADEATKKVVLDMDKVVRECALYWGRNEIPSMAFILKASLAWSAVLRNAGITEEQARLAFGKNYPAEIAEVDGNVIPLWAERKR